MGYKQNKRIEDNNEPKEKKFVPCGVTTDNDVQFTNCVIKSESEDDEWGCEYGPTTGGKAQTWPCKKCDQVFPTKLALASHTQSGHACKRDFQNYSCNHCNQVFSSKHKLGTHRNTEHATVEYEKPTFKFDEAQKLYVCNTCSAEYQNQTEIEEHLKTHEKNFKCIVCKEKFERAYDLGTHSIVHYDDKMFRCPLCTYKTATRKRLHIHIISKHLKNFPYICKDCGKGFMNPVFYKEHNNEHLGVKPFTCVVCTMTFTYSRYLLNHQIRMHKADIDDQILTNQCTTCKKVFGKPAALKRHLKRAHVTREKKHLCDTCGKGFAEPSMLNAHYRIHTGVKPFRCTHCDKSFRKKTYLVLHERVHSGEKPFACEHCGKCFNQETPLRVHQRTHTGERPYVCQFCTKGFTSRGALNIHCKSCTGEI